MWQPGWEEGLGENGYVYTYGWVPSLFTWNYYNIVNQLLEKEMATHSGIHAWKIPWSLVGYSPWGCKELDTTEWLHFHFQSAILQYKIKSFYRKLKRKKNYAEYFFKKACLSHPWHLYRWIFILCVSPGKRSFLTPGNEQGMLWTQDMEERKTVLQRSCLWMMYLKILFNFFYWDGSTPPGTFLAPYYAKSLPLPWTWVTVLKNKNPLFMEEPDSRKKSGEGKNTSISLMK